MSIIEENKVTFANCNFSKINFIFYFGASPITRISNIESNKVKLQTVPQKLIFNFGAQPIRGVSHSGAQPAVRPSTVKQSKRLLAVAIVI